MKMVTVDKEVKPATKNLAFNFIIVWLVLVGDITRALIGLLSLNCRALFSRNAHN